MYFFKLECPKPFPSPLFVILGKKTPTRLDLWEIGVRKGCTHGFRGNFELSVTRGGRAYTPSVLQSPRGPAASAFFFLLLLISSNLQKTENRSIKKLNLILKKKSHLNYINKILFN